MKNITRTLRTAVIVVTALGIKTQVFAVGASMPFVSYEAESGTVGGGATVVSLPSGAPSNNNSSAAVEASGHSYVHLSATGQNVTLTNNTGQSITALNVRYSIPDSSGGGGITSTLNLYVNGTFRQSINVNSIQTWCYQSTGAAHGWSQSPSSGSPHIFWDETHFFINAPAVPAGATITLQKDSGNSASFYNVDVVDMENPPGPVSQPANSLSITTYGAVANNSSSDSTTAIQNCINAAQSQGKIVWIPSGTFYLTSPSASLSATSITIQGAGMWYSVIYANPTLPDTSEGNILNPTSCTVQDLAFNSNAHSGASGDGNGGGPNVKGSNWNMNRLWIEHLGAGIWADGTTGIVQNCRLDCTWGDGININNGNGGSGNGNGDNLTVNNCFVRGTGDDGLAINCAQGTGLTAMANPTITSCTAVAPWAANCLGIYGGQNILVQDNLCTDSAGEFGISVGQFGSTGAPLQSGTVSDNTILRGGGYSWGSGLYPALNVGTTGTITNVTVAGNTVNNAVYAGMGLNYCGTGVVVGNNVITSPWTTGVIIPSGSTGSAQLSYNAVYSLNSGQSALVNNASGFTANQNGNSWQSFTKKLVPGTTISLQAMANNDYVCADNSGTSPLIANRTSVGQWESFKVIDAGSGNIGFQALANNDDVCADSGGASPLIANRTSVGPWESFTELDAGGGKTALRALANNAIVTADDAGASPLIANRDAVGSWETFTVATH